MITRLGLFVVTNIAILAVLALVFRLLGLEGILDERGVDLQLGPLMVYAGVIGMSGSFISLLLSKWTARRMTGAQVIAEASNEREAWLVETIPLDERIAPLRGLG